MAGEAVTARNTSSSVGVCRQKLRTAGVFDVHDDPDDEFIFGLERILDGLDALVRTRP